MLEVKVGSDGTVFLAGRLDAAQVDKARTAFDRLSESTVIDLSELTYISSAGLGLFIEVHRRLSGSGKTLRLTNPSDMVRNVFRLSRLDRLIAIG